VDVVLGRRLVMPVTVQGPLDPRQLVTARLDDGRRLSASLQWLSVALDAAPSVWLAPAGRWTVTPASADRLPQGSGLWAVVLDLPIDAAGQGLWVNDQRIVLNWLPDPGSLGADAEAWLKPLGDVPPGSTLLRLAAPELGSPLRRWRFHLLMTGLRPDARPPTELDLAEPIPGLGVIFDDPVLEALARQTESRWQVALAKLWLANADLAHRLKRRLMASVNFGGRVLAPAWSTSQEDLDALLSDLLNPRLSSEALADRAMIWLENQPAAAAWITDDAGLREAQSSRPIALASIANLTERATLAWASTAQSSNAAGLTTVSALEVAQVSITAPEAFAREGTTAVTLHAGAWETQRSVNWSRAAVRPPGLRIEPLWYDWTMLAWTGGSPVADMAPASEWATAALLYRDDARSAPGEAARWMLMVECRIPEGQSPQQESVRIWLGPFGSPSSVLKAAASGMIIDERSPDQGTRGQFSAATVARLSGRWIAHIPIPPGAVEPDGTLRIALERLEATGRRCAWPRPMLPWQSEPGRIVVDTSTWGDIRAASP
jgi:hypothetical protein